FVTNPCSYRRQILDHVRAIHCIFFHGEKLDRAPAFAQRFLFPPETGVDQTKHAQRRAVIWLSLDDFLLLRACRSKSRPRFLIVFCHTSNDAFCKWTIERNILDSKGHGLLAKCDQGIFCSSDVAFAQCAYKPKFSDTRHRGRICGSNGIDCLMQRPARRGEFSQSTVVIAVRPIKILPTREMRFTSIRTKARGGLKGGFR